MMPNLKGRKLAMLDRKVNPATATALIHRTSGREQLARATLIRTAHKAGCAILKEYRMLRKQVPVTYHNEPEACMEGLLKGVFSLTRRRRLIANLKVEAHKENGLHGPGRIDAVNQDSSTAARSLLNAKLNLFERHGTQNRHPALPMKRSTHASVPTEGLARMTKTDSRALRDVGFRQHNHIKVAHLKEGS